MVGKCRDGERERERRLGCTQKKVDERGEMEIYTGEVCCIDGEVWGGGWRGEIDADHARKCQGEDRRSENSTRMMIFTVETFRIGIVKRNDDEK